MTRDYPTGKIQIYATKDNIQVFTDTSPTSDLWQFSPDHDSKNTRPFQKGDLIGYYLGPRTAVDGTPYVKIQGFAFRENGFLKGWHEIDQDVFMTLNSDDWISETERNIPKATDKKVAFLNMLTTTILPSWPGVPAPTAVENKTNSITGKDDWYLTWANGYGEWYETFSSLTPATMLTYTTAAKNDPTSGTGTGTGTTPTLADASSSGSGTGTTTISKLALWGIILGVVFLIVIGVVLVIQSKRRKANGTTNSKG